MKRFFMLLWALTLSLTAEGNPLPKIFITKSVDHPALEATTAGILEALRQAGYEDEKTAIIRVESAQASPALAAQIASKFVNQGADVVVGVGTMAAQSFAKAAADGKTALIFSSVTDPLSAGLVGTLDKPGQNTSGVSNFVDLEPQLALFQKLQPNLKRLGIIYNPGELNSISIVKKLEALCTKLGLTLIKQTASKTADVPQAAVKLAGEVDALFISNDNTALSSLQSIIRAANAAHIPVYVSDTDAVALGALAALGPNQFEVGLETGKMIVKVLKGEKTGTLSVAFSPRMDLVMNAKTAQACGITIPKEVRARAEVVIS